MKSAIVTGASSGIGKACAKRLLDLGFKVYGIARDFEKCEIDSSDFYPITCDLTDTKSIENLKEHIESDALHVLIHAAGVGYFAPHEDLSLSQIEEIITLNLTAPLMLSKLFLKPLKQNSGYLFTIASISGIQPALMGAAYGASKAGLRHFATSLFKEARKSGLKVININPDITDTPFFDDLHFYPSNDPLCAIAPSDIADIIEDVLDKRSGTVLTEVTVEPQKFQLEKKKRP